MNAARDLIGKINDAIVNPLIVFLIALAFFWFLWGVAVFIMNSDSEEKRSTGKRHMIWGVVGMFVMVGVFGILRIVLNTFGIDIPDGIKGN